MYKCFIYNIIYNVNILNIHLINVNLAVFCDDVSTENDNKSEEKGVSKDSQQNITTIPSGTSPDGKNLLNNTIMFIFS